MTSPHRPAHPGPARDFVGYGPEPPDFDWPGGARIAINLVVNYEEGCEYSLNTDGVNDTWGEYSFQYGPDANYGSQTPPVDAGAGTTHTHATADLAGPLTRLGGLRHGVIVPRTSSVLLREVELVPGVRVSGTLPSSGAARLTVNGRSAVRGSVRARARSKSTA